MSVRSVSILFMAAVAVLGVASTSHAAQRVAGPSIDLKADYFTVPNSGGIPTVSHWVTIWGSPYQSPTWGAPATIFPYPPGASDNGFGGAFNTFNDYIIIGNGGSLNDSPARYAAAAAYISYDDESLPTGNMLMTTIYGQDPNPGTPGVSQIQGYNTNELYPILSDEHVTGPSGTTYSASAFQLMPISGLGTLLGPSADLSLFTGDPNLSVWVFQTSMPFGEMGVVPEPTTALLLIGFVAMAGVAVRRRR